MAHRLTATRPGTWNVEGWLERPVARLHHKHKFNVLFQVCLVPSHADAFEIYSVFQCASQLRRFHCCSTLGPVFDPFVGLATHYTHGAAGVCRVVYGEGTKKRQTTCRAGNLSTKNVTPGAGLFLSCHIFVHLGDLTMPEINNTKKPQHHR